jgi:hypothetical protein
MALRVITTTIPLWRRRPKGAWLGTQAAPPPTTFIPRVRLLDFGGAEPELVVRKTGAWLTAPAVVEQMPWGRKRLGFDEPLPDDFPRRAGAWLPGAAPAVENLPWGKKRLDVPEAAPEDVARRTGGWQGPQQGPPVFDSIAYLHRFRGAYDVPPPEFSEVVPRPGGALFGPQAKPLFRWYIKV